MDISISPPSKPLWNKVSKAWIGIIAMYVLGWFTYAFAIYFTSGFSFNPFWRTGLDYLLKAAWTLPVWWLLFQKLADKPSWIRYASHVIIFPIWLIGWIITFYYVCEKMNLGRLGGYGIGWDIYIPTLFYAIQFGIFHLYDESQRLVRQKVRAAELRESSIKNELSALKAQLNPHFLYNVFNTINASLSPEQEHTRELIAQLADLFRYQLRASRSETVPLQDELNFLQSYLELEKARFGERLTIKWDIDDGLQHTPVPPMLLQPLVENAIRHGISPKVEGGSVHISIHIQGSNIMFSIVDDGVGLGKESSLTGEGVGLNNASKILQNLYGSELHVSNNPNRTGTRVTFSLPKNNVA